MSGQQQRRRRDSGATRAALLNAAAELFAERGYDRTTVRDIAARAGVNQALLFRYFGSKDALFGAIIARRGRDQLAVAPAEQVFARVLRAMVAPGQSPPPDQALETLLRSSGHDTAADAIRREVGNDYAMALASSTDAPDAELRADLVLAWLVGINVLRSVNKEPLASADGEVVVEHVLRAVRTLLEKIQDVSD